MGKRILSALALTVLVIMVSLMIRPIRIAYAQTFIFAIDAFQAIQTVDFVPTLIPNAGTNVGLAQDFYYTDIRVTNITGGSVTVTIMDRQGTPRALAQALPIAANSVVQFTCVHGCRMPGGLNWQASAATSLVGYIKGYYN